MSEGVKHPATRSPTKRLIHSFFNLLYPSACVTCGQSGTLFCPTCQADVLWISSNICRYCGIGVAQAGLDCHTCQHHPFPIKQIRAAAWFQKTICPAIHTFKYKNKIALAEPLAQLMGDAWENWQIPVDLVLAIPLHSEREQERGYNQAQLLANQFAKRFNYPCETNALFRQRATRPQVGLSEKARRSNVAGAFVADKKMVAGKKILLIDDVCTTGSTILASAESLYTAGAAQVSGYVLARAGSPYQHTYQLIKSQDKRLEGLSIL